MSRTGLLLLGVTAIALVWANAAPASYGAVWEAHVAGASLQVWIDDALMTVFFFVVGLEIRRETVEGELASLRQAALPIAAALGGMVVPVAIFLVLNRGRAGAAGWAVPMATDIAFALGVLALLGDRIALRQRVLLLALAVIDDIGAIVVIAVFYSDGTGNGLHPSIAGVVAGLLVPAALRDRLIGRLQPVVAFVVMPVFALANAGVAVGGARLSGDHGWLFAGIVAGLAIGKPLGITLGALAARPTGHSRRGVLVVGVVGGIGFTMSLFIAQLAFPAGPLLDTAKLAILIGSGVALVAGLVFGTRDARPRVGEGGSHDEDVAMGGNAGADRRVRRRRYQRRSAGPDE